MSRCIQRSLVVVTMFAATALFAAAQTSTSRVTGRVVDSKQASIAGASVTITNEATGVSQTQTTTEAGVYAFEALPVGDYTVTVEQNGFKKFQKTGNHLEVNNPLTVDIVMEIGQVSEVVTVQGGPEQLQTANATMSNVVEQKAIERGFAQTAGDPEERYHRDEPSTNEEVTSGSAGVW